ncbi:hypothetical protein C4E44_22575 [Pseudomonas sp. MWU12-2312b]|nr:hypothetical protein C4E44_22575 [Pseudomonas sp. MWU12-2312b]
MIVNGNAYKRVKRGAIETIAGKPAPQCVAISARALRRITCGGGTSPVSAPPNARVRRHGLFRPSPAPGAFRVVRQRQGGVTLSLKSQPRVRVN